MKRWRSYTTTLLRTCLSWLLAWFGLRGAPHRMPAVDVRNINASDHRLALCIVELEQVHGIIAWYDDTVMCKKSWCIALWSILSAWGMYSASTAIVLLALTVLAGFAISEMVLRRYQRRYVVRAEELDAFLAHGELSQYEYSLATTPSRSDRRREIWYALKQPHFTAFYSLFALASMACAIVLSR